MNRITCRVLRLLVCGSGYLAAFLTAGCARPIENAHMRLLFSADQPAEPLQVINRSTGRSFTISTTAPLLQFKQGQVGGSQLRPSRAAARFFPGGSSLVIEYPRQQVGFGEILMRRIITLPGESAWFRQHVEFDAVHLPGSPRAPQLTLERVVLLDEPLPEPAEFTMPGWQSYPVFTESLFFGVEFPVASAVVKDGRIILSHAPGMVMNLDASYRSREAVVGVCPPGRVRESFERYVDSFRRKRKGPHFNYNSWWTAPVPFSEKDILGLIETFENHLYRPFGVAMDSLTLDMGWSARKGIWQIDRSRFPGEFTPLNRALAAQSCRLGLWWSPSNNYTPSSFDSLWAAEQGYETQSLASSIIRDYRVCCLAKGTRYQAAAKEAIAGLAKRFKLGQMKFDGYRHECKEADHGHLPDELSREVTAEGIIDIFEAVREASPDIWMEPTCFGYDASPWWLRYVESVIGPFGDDAPAGVVPAPVYRESYTTSRDFYNLCGAVTPVPIAAQEVLGIIHQTPEPLYNDAVVAVLRGHQFISLYLNPKYLRSEEYRFLADLIKWVRANASLLQRTKVIWPRTWREKGVPAVEDSTAMQRETYGYAHWNDGQGLLCLRNPWIQMDPVEVPLDEATIGADVAFERYSAIQEYPCRRCVAVGLKRGDKLRLSMGPYETKVIRICPSIREDQPEPSSGQACGAKVASAKSRAVKTTAQPPATQPFGDDYTIVTPPEGLRWTATIEGQSTGNGWKVYYLLESDKSPEVLDPVFMINGLSAESTLIDSAGQWCASGLKSKHGWKWYVVDLPAGQWQVSATMNMPQQDISASAWLIQPFDPPAAIAEPALHKGRMPLLPLPPDYRSQTSVVAIAPTKLLTPHMDDITLEPKIVRIPGIYLDRLEPVSVKQGWGGLMKNKSVWDKTMCIGSQVYHRGIGTHAPAEVVYDLGGKYTTFHGLAGQDAAANGTISFEIHVDGRKSWESGIMTRLDSAREFNVLVTGAKTLTIIVTDGGDGIVGDHADLADAWLER
ncbi:MAG: NPCBM/NEW2 domain-containing protein [Phycisphaerae bacterium]